jgi:hypothetical protein
LATRSAGVLPNCKLSAIAGGQHEGPKWAQVHTLDNRRSQRYAV